MDYFSEANDLYKTKEYKKAIELYKKAVETEDNQAASLYNAAVCFIKLKEFEKAVPLLKLAIKENGSSKYYFNLAYCYAMLKDNRKALVNFNTAWALNNNDEDCCKAINIIISKLK
jgi:tetratricopeptide (TPR) repeat protein